MALVWHLIESTLGDASPWSVDLGRTGVRAIAVSIRDPKEPALWRAVEHGEQRATGSGFHAEYENRASGDVVHVHFDGQLRAEPVRIAFAIEE